MEVISPPTETDGGRKIQQQNTYWRGWLMYVGVHRKKLHAAGRQEQQIKLKLPK